MADDVTSTVRAPAPVAPVERGSQPELVQLRHGLSVTVRAVQPGDEMPLSIFLHGLSAHARSLRFFSGGVDLDLAAHWAADMGEARCGLVAHDEAGVIVAHAVFIPLDPTHAEVAVEVADDLHGCGLGTVLIERLAAIAERRAITYFVAEVLCENRAMLDVFREGFDARVIFHDGPEERVEFLTSSWRLAEQRFAAVGVQLPVSITRRCGTPSSSLA